MAIRHRPGDVRSFLNTAFNRSFRLNDEATLNILDAPFAAQQTATFEADLRNSRVVTYAQWQARPLQEKVAEIFASVIGSQL